MDDTNENEILIEDTTLYADTTDDTPEAPRRIIQTESNMDQVPEIEDEDSMDDTQEDPIMRVRGEIPTLSDIRELPRDPYPQHIILPRAPEPKELLYTDQKEIRINSEFASFLRSDYEGSLEENSIPKTRERVVPSHKYFDRMIREINPQMGNSMLPMHCRYVEKFRNLSVYVLEEPPAFRTICLEIDLAPEVEELRRSGKLDEYGYENYMENNEFPFMVTLALPFSVFIMLVDPSEKRVLDSLFLFRTQPLTGLGDYFLKSPFLNISDSQYVCFGDDVGNSERSEIEAIEKARASWWSTKFNSDYTYNHTEYQNTAGVSNYLTWQYLSKKDPMFIYQVDWIKHKKTLSEELQQIRKREDDNRGSRFGYENMFKLFSFANKSEKTREVEEGCLRDIYYDVSNGFIEGNLMVNVGDSFKYKNGELAHIISCAGWDAGYTDFLLLLYKGKEFLFKLTEKSRKFVVDKVIEERFISEVVTPAGLTLKANQILCLNGPFGSKIYKKVGYIRPAIDGKQEVRIGGQFHLLENLTEDFEVVDMTKPKLSGIDLKEGEKYIYDRRPRGMTRTYSNVEFAGVEINRSGALEFQFDGMDEGSEGSRIRLDTTSDVTMQGMIFRESEMEELPKVFAISRKLQMIKDRVSGDTINGFRRDSLIYRKGNTRYIAATLSMIEEECLTDDTLTISTADMDVSFKIGDKVVAVDCENPINTLNIKTITEFKINRDEGTISFVLIDKQGQLHDVVYIRVGSNMGSTIFYMGRIRKITNIFNDIWSGSKIVAKVAGIPVFPKKDTNIIIGFITDTGGDDPLVLCSNGCTQWFSDLIENFEIIKMSDPRWKTLNHAPLDMSKIKLQVGDIVFGGQYYSHSYGYLICRNSHNRGMKAIYLDSYSSSDYVTVDSYFAKDVLFDSIPNPRMRQIDKLNLGVVQATPNFHGLYTRKNAGIHLLEDTRRFINV